MKKIIAFLILTAMLFTLFGCNGSNKDNSAEDTDMSLYESVDVTSHGAKNDGSASCIDAIVAAANEIGTKQALFFPDGKYLIDKSVEITPAVRLSGNATFEIAKGVTVKFSGLFEASERKIFSGSGNVRITNENVWGYPVWFDIGENNDTKQIQKAVDSLRSVYIPNSKYQISSITVSSPTNIVGIGATDVPITAMIGTTALFDIQSSNVRIENFRIDMTKTKKEANCILFNTSKASIDNIYLKNVYVNGGYVSITDSASETNAATNVTLDAVTLYCTRATPLIFKNLKSGIKFCEVDVSRRKSLGAAADVPGLIMENNEGAVFEHFDVNGDIEPKELDGHGMVLKNCSKIKMNRVLMEYVGGSGFVFENCSEFTFDNVQVYTFYNRGFEIKGLKNSVLNVIRSTYTLDGDVSKQYENFILEDCENVTINGLTTYYSRGAGMSIKNCKDVTINSFQSLYRNGLAISDEGGNSNVVINGYTDDKAGNAISLKDNGITINNAIIGQNEAIEKISGKGIY